MRNWLIELRMKKNLSRSEFARNLGISRVFLYEIEKGKKNPSGRVALKISKELGFDMKKFYEFTDENLYLFNLKKEG